MGTLNPETLRKMVESANRKLNELEKVQKSRKIGRYVYDENKEKLVYRKFDFGDVRYADSSASYGSLRSKADGSIPYIVYDEKTRKLRFKATLNDIKKMNDTERRRLYNHLRNFNKNKTSTKRNIDEQFIKAYSTYKKHQKEYGIKSVISFQEYFKFITNSDYNRMFSMFGSTVVVDIMEGRLGVIENEHISTDVTANLLTQIFNNISPKFKAVNGKISNTLARNLVRAYTDRIKQIDSPFDITNEKDFQELIKLAQSYDIDTKPHMSVASQFIDMEKIRAGMRSTDDDD